MSYFFCIFAISSQPSTDKNFCKKETPKKMECLKNVILFVKEDLFNINAYKFKRGAGIGVRRRATKYDPFFLTFEGSFIELDICSYKLK